MPMIPITTIRTPISESTTLRVRFVLSSYASSAATDATPPRSDSNGGNGRGGRI